MTNLSVYKGKVQTLDGWLISKLPCVCVVHRNLEGHGKLNDVEIHIV